MQDAHLESEDGVTALEDAHDVPVGRILGVEAGTICDGVTVALAAAQNPEVVPVQMEWMLKQHTRHQSATEPRQGSAASQGIVLRTADQVHNCMVGPGQAAAGLFVPAHLSRDHCWACRSKHIIYRGFVSDLFTRHVRAGRRIPHR